MFFFDKIFKALYDWLERYTYETIQLDIFFNNACFFYYFLTEDIKCNYVKLSYSNLF